MRKFLALSLLVFAAACGADSATNQPPTVRRQSIVTAEDTPVAFDLVVEDAEGDPASVTMGSARHGELDGAGLRWTYVPAPDFHGDDVVTVTVRDDAGATTGAIAITVGAVNDLPSARPDAFAARMNRPLPLGADALLANDADVDGDGALVIAGVTPGAHGDVALADGVVVFTPPAGWSGVTGFTYALSDGLALGEGAVTITVDADNLAPVATADQLEVIEDGYLSVAVAALLANDADPDRDTLFVTAVDQPVGGTVALSSGSVVFTPAPDFHGRGGFQYTVSDGAETAIGAVEVGVAPVDDPPVAVADRGTSDEDEVFTIAAADLLANDVDVDGDRLAVISVEAVVGGAVALDGGLITFTPDTDVHGPARFTYKLSDGVTAVVAAFDLTIAPINDAPIALTDTAAAVEDVKLVLVAPALVANDRDVDGDLLTVIAVEALVGGTVTHGGGQGNNRITFNPDADFHGTAGFRYTISDGAEVASAAVVIEVAPVNDAPIAHADSADGTEDEALVIPVADLVGNDTDVDGDALDVVAIADVFGGTAELAGAHVTFVPAPDFHGVAGFTYQISDGSLTVASTMSLSIGAVIECGDGEIDGAAIGALGGGETCDDGNTAPGDGCGGDCQLEDDFETTDPVLVSGALGCSSQRTGAGRTIAVDALGNVYAAMRCGGDAYLAMSDDRGATFQAPIAAGVTAIAEIAVAAGGPGVAYVAATAGGQVHFTQTQDGGRTWAAPKPVGTAAATALSIEAFQDDVYVGVAAAGGVTVLHNGSRGVGAWTASDVAIAQVSFDLVHDDVTGTLRVCSTTPGFHVRASTDLGATFAAETTPPGLADDADWAVGGGSIFVAGTAGGSELLTRIATSDPTLVTSLAGLPASSHADQRSVAADPSGNAYVTTTLDGGALQLDRLVAGDPGFDTPRTIAVSGSYPGTTALPTSIGVAVLYTDGTSVYATIQTY